MGTFHNSSDISSSLVLDTHRYRNKTSMRRSGANEHVQRFPAIQPWCSAKFRFPPIKITRDTALLPVNVIADSCPLPASPTGMH